MAIIPSGSFVHIDVLATGDLVYFRNGSGIIEQIQTQTLSLLQADGTRSKANLVCYKVGHQWYSTFNLKSTPIYSYSRVGELKKVVFYNDKSTGYPNPFQFARVLKFEYASSVNRFKTWVHGPWLQIMQLWDDESKDWGEIITSEDWRIRDLDRIGVSIKEPISNSSSLVLVNSPLTGSKGEVIQQGKSYYGH